ncbi:hypothetical protein VdG1_00915 [Verticillium dahliae VDG1]|nr:hypothetical protein VdG1_00915 [Verticillium dahliae VDG1]
MSSLEAKIVVLGSQGVGKTSLVERFCKGSFNPSQITSTVGASFMTKRVVDGDSDTTVRLQIWDTAGQERFRSISRLYYRGANACILCYSITDAQSFAEMGLWLNELRRNLPADVVLHVVGTKADMVARDPSLREVPFERCIAYQQQQQHAQNAPSDAAHPRSPSSKRSSGFWGQEAGWDACHEISAESGEGVEEVFRVVTRKLVEQNRKIQQALLQAMATPGTPGFGAGEAGYFDGAVYGGAGSAGGSFRVGRDRRSWLFSPGFTVPGVPVEVAEEREEMDGTVGRRKRCC